MKTAKALLVSALLFTSVAQASDISLSPDGASVYIISPSNGKIVSKTFTVKFGLQGMGVAPAGVEKPKTGHHHLIINGVELPPMNTPLGGDIMHLALLLEQANMPLSPVRAKGVSAAELAAEQSKVYAAQVDTNQRGRNYIDEVLKARLGTELAQRNKVVAQSEQELQQVAAENRGTLSQLDAADEDAFYGIKAFLDPEIKSKDELEDIRRKQVSRMDVLENKRNLADANYQRSLAEASLKGKLLSKEATLLETQLKAVDENMEVQKGLLELESTEYETDMAQYDLDGLYKLRTLGAQSKIPAGVLEQGIRDRVKGASLDLIH